MPRSLSPLSVPYRVLQRGGGIAVAVAFAMGGGFDVPGVGPAGPLVLLALAGAGALALIGYETAYVRRFSYDLGADTLDIESGVLSRRSREIPLRRIQNVDISRNVVQRLFGIAVVSFETAGGGETEATLRFVSFEEAKRLQATLGRLKRSDEEADGDEDAAETGSDAESPAGDRPADPAGRRFEGPSETELFALGRTELALVGALSIDFRVPGVLFLIVSTVSSTVVPTFLSSASGVALAVAATLVLVGIAVLSWIVGAAAAIAQYYGFRLVRSGEELQYERGLFQRYDGSIPFDKIQTLTLSENPLKRHFGYATLYIETAGYAPGSGGSSRGSEAAVPLAKRERVLALIEALEPVGDVEFRRPPKRARRRYLVRYLLVVGVLTGIAYAADAFVPLPFPPWSPAILIPLAVWYAHATWTHRGHWLGDHHVVTRNGVLRRQTKIVPYYRIQTVIDARTVFQRRLDLATVTVDTAGSLSVVGQDAAAVDISGARADDLREELETRLDGAVDAYRAGRAGIGIDDAYDAGDPDPSTGATADADPEDPALADPDRSGDAEDPTDRD
ncbi:PH domain-containing protein [Halobellus ruber]|uniref:PH domain-containing protein n=1 Tax=Halobellus ruber TaxID=2761102 RepID=A0A7J9SFR1_9EURY|nr:PH domain-containing protein [Halobellus ruber]MBB6645342.1 PH domain-containing protein [Halobellus ruber]